MSDQELYDQVYIATIAATVGANPNPRQMGVSSAEEMPALVARMADMFAMAAVKHRREIKPGGGHDRR